jgi:hypothetical protein
MPRPRFIDIDFSPCMKITGPPPNATASRACHAARCGTAAIMSDTGTRLYFCTVW